MLEQLFGTFDEFADNFFGYRGNVAVDVVKKENGYVVYANMPGVNKKDIKINYEHNYLTIEANVEAKEDEKYLLQERIRTYKRSLYLPDDIDNEKTVAKFENGVLEIDLSQKEKNVKKILIE